MRTNSLLSFCLASLSIIAASPILGIATEAEKHVDVPGAVTFDHNGQVERRGLYVKNKTGVESLGEHNSEVAHTHEVAPQPPAGYFGVARAPRVALHGLSMAGEYLDFLKGDQDIVLDIGAFDGGFFAAVDHDLPFVAFHGALGCSTRAKKRLRHTQARCGRATVGSHARHRATAKSHLVATRDHPSHERDQSQAEYATACERLLAEIFYNLSQNEHETRVPVPIRLKKHY
ncbi:hypothetical protein BKA70DRAFT_1242323 [Coprinopsis sp. MPI-PUGE-AT-0042]|nr:hypothetical protein BKA70DRAFT_1242323 [Coprinopsis sp. MPI-PUGE-AT-0042]